jgi:hypothetical protein
LALLLGNTNADREFLAGCTAGNMPHNERWAWSVVGADRVTAGAEASIVKPSWGAWRVPTRRTTLTNTIP